MATSKFKRMLNKELSHISESKSGSQISEFILRTYVDKQEELDLPFRKDELEAFSRTGRTDSLSNTPATGQLPGQQATATDQSAQTTPQVQLTEQQLRHIEAQQKQLAEHQKQPPAYQQQTSMQKIRTTGSNKHMSPVGVRSRNQLQHSNSINQLPKYGVMCGSNENEEKVGELLNEVNAWGMDLFALADYSGHRPLTVIMYSIFKQRNLLKTFQISATTFLNCMLTLEDHYQSVPYHNACHAADVVQSVHVLLNCPALDVSSIKIFDFSLIGLLISEVFQALFHFFCN